MMAWTGFPDKKPQAGALTLVGFFCAVRVLRNSILRAD